MKPAIGTITEAIIIPSMAIGTIIPMLGLQLLLVQPLLWLLLRPLRRMRTATSTSITMAMTAETMRSLHAFTRRKDELRGGVATA
jgi:hypothetical protein